MTLSTPYQRILAGEEVLYFNHVAKTGGWSVHKVLEEFFGPGDICPWHAAAEVEAEPLETLRNYKVFRGHLCMGWQHRLDRPMHMITMMREPVQREISGVFQRMRDKECFPDLPDDFAACLEVPAVRAHMGQQYPVYLVEGGQWMGPVEAVEQTCEAIDNCLFVGLTERFSESMALLAYKLGWPMPSSLSHANRRPPEQEVDVPAAAVEEIARWSGPDRDIYAHAVARFERDLEAMHRDLLAQRATGLGSAGLGSAGLVPV